MDPTGLQHEPDLAQCADIHARVAVHHHEIGGVTLGDRPDLFAEPERFGRQRGEGDDQVAGARRIPVGPTELASRRATNRSRIAVRADIALAYPA